MKHPVGLPEIPVIDLFAGPGGLGEGFSRCERAGTNPFRVRLSVECSAAAHSTLELRSFVRQFAPGGLPEEYYRFVRGEGLSREQLLALFPVHAAAARRQAWCATLGAEDLTHEEVDARIREAVGEATMWVLVGGPPCQAYSLAGRSRNRAKADYRAEDDHRHFLYREYLRILERHRPPVFVMENVKGVLSARIGGRSIFERMISDLQMSDGMFAGGDGTPGYRIYSLARPTRGFDLFGTTECSPTDYIVECERYGIPQRRHRVLLLGVRQDIRLHPETLQPRKKPCTARQALGDLPRLRAAVSVRSHGSEGDSAQLWKQIVREVLEAPWARPADGDTPEMAKTRKRVLEVAQKLRLPARRLGGEFVKTAAGRGPAIERSWFGDARLGGACNHSARSHMASDFHRYLWAACYAQVNGVSPRLRDFPQELRPAHRNVDQSLDHDNFSDRFKVQLADEPSATVMSHISKDGHYYIHYDATQCRSLTVREAARLQTFPDNYFFCGNRTEQYTQVGNAVPPLIARQIADVVLDLLERAQSAHGRQNQPGAALREHVPDPVEEHRTGADCPIADAPRGAAVPAA